MFVGFCLFPLSVYLHIQFPLICCVGLYNPFSALPGSLAIGMCVLRDFLGLNAFWRLFLLRGAAAWNVRQRCLNHSTNVFPEFVEIPWLDSHWSVWVTPCWQFPVTLCLVSQAKSFSPSLTSCSDSQQKAKSIFIKFISSLPSILYYTVLWIILQN